MMIDIVTKKYLNGEFVCYKVTYVNSNRVRLVPLDEANTDYQEILEWVEKGGVIVDNGA
jgi:hypothetical protein